MKRLYLFSVLVLFAFFSISGAAAQEAEPVNVTADGYSYMGDDDTIKEAREKALAEAERNALEQGTDVYIDSMTEVKNFQLERDEIRKRVRGRVKNRKILTDELNRSELKYHVKIQCQVEMVPISEEELARKKEEEPEEALADIPESRVPDDEEGSGEVAMATPGARKARAPRPAGVSQPLTGDAEKYRRYLVVLKNRKPERYVDALLTLEPRLNNSERLAAMIRAEIQKKRVLGRLVRQEVGKVRPASRSGDRLAMFLKGARENNPRAFIRVVEMVFPRLRPRELAGKLAAVKEKNPEVFRRVVRIMRDAA